MTEWKKDPGFSLYTKSDFSLIDRGTNWELVLRPRKVWSGEIHTEFQANSIWEAMTKADRIILEVTQ